MSSKIRADVLVHMHADFDVTTNRLVDFADASREIQLQVIAELRQRAGNDWGATEIALFAIAVSLAGTALASSIKPNVALGALPQLVAALVVVLAVALGLLPFAIATVRDHNRKSYARVWLGAYTDELARRHLARGRAARIWQRSH